MRDHRVLSVACSGFVAVAQALLPVRYAWSASALGTGKSACATGKLIRDGCPLLFFSARA